MPLFESPYDHLFGPPPPPSNSRYSYLDPNSLPAWPGGQCRSGNVLVRVHEDNVREMRFLDRPAYVQGQLQCKGPAPPPVQGSCTDAAVRKALRCDGVTVRTIDEQLCFSRLVARPVVNMCKGGRSPKILVLGLGAWMLPANFKASCPGSEIVVVEKSAEVANAAKDFFGFDGKVLVGDASAVLADYDRRVNGGKLFEVAMAKLQKSRLGKEEAEHLRKLTRPERLFDVAIVDIQNHSLAKADWKHLNKLMKPGGLVELNWSEPSTVKREVDNFKFFFPDAKIHRGCEHTKNTILFGHTGTKETNKLKHLPTATSGDRENGAAGNLWQWTSSFWR